jgi:hypothetical protein
MSEIGNSFKSIQFYNKEMKKGMEDKLFFVDKLPKNQSYCFVDFGCADGSMISALAEIYKNTNQNQYKFIGYDISETMIDLARTNYSGPLYTSVKFTTNWNEVKSEMPFLKNYKNVLILSSVIHEVYSYADENHTIDDFWKKVLCSGFDYIIIRDMCPSDDINRTSDKSDFMKISTNNHPDIKRELLDFCGHWGTIDNYKNLVHFLLKYRWKVNWNREVNENYFPITIQDLFEKFGEYSNVYILHYFERFRVPFLDQCFKEDFDIELNDYTHIKAIYEAMK